MMTIKIDRKLIKHAILVAFNELLGFAPASSRVVFASNWGDMFYVYSKDGARLLYKFAMVQAFEDSWHLVLYRKSLGDDSWICLGKSYAVWSFENE